MVFGAHGAGHQGTIGVVAEAHDVFHLVVLPLHEGLVDGLDIETRIIGRGQQVLHIVALEPDHLFGIGELLFALAPGLRVFPHRVEFRQFDAAHYDITGVPCLSVEHVEGVKLVLHSEIEKPGVIFPDDALVEIERPQPVCRLETKFLREEGEVVLVASAKNNGIDLLG